MATSCWARTSSGLRGHDRGLDGPLVHQPRDDGRLEEVAAVLGEDDAPRWLADLVAGAPDALQPAGDRERRLDLDDEVHGAHVDAQLQRAGGHERRQPALLEQLLDEQPLLAGEGAMVGPDEVLAGQLVELERQALREPAAVGEDDGAAMRADELQDARVDRRPDAGARSGPAAGPPGASSSGMTSPSRPMSSTGTTTWSSSGLRTPASTMVTGRAVAPVRRPGCLTRLAAGHPGRPPRPTAVAAWPTARCAGAAAAAMASSRSSESARCAPRLVPARAWISSTMTQRTPPQRLPRLRTSAAGTATPAW